MAIIAQWRRRINRSLFQDPTIRTTLRPQVIERHCQELGHSYRDSFWSPSITILTFLLQVLSSEKTLRAAVAEVLSQLDRSREPARPSSDPAAYCQARRRLPYPLVERLSEELAGQMQKIVDKRGQWRGHLLKMVDGSTVSMPDTPSLQKAFPQPESQKPGCGFPVARMVSLFCWATGALLRLEVSDLHVSEVTLLRKHYDDWFEPGDVLLADRHYCSYVDLARLRRRDINVIMRLHQRRKSDFRRGKRLGPDDRLVEWDRPTQWLRSFGVSRDDFQKLPETLTLRQIRVADVPKGFRSRAIVVVTTLIDPLQYPADEIRALYRDRWMAELNLRSLKTHLGMEVLRGKSEDVVRKEIAMHMLAYNLIRLLMWRAAREHDRNLHRLSFTGTLHRLHKTMPQTMTSSIQREREMLQSLLADIVDDELPDRPGRMEPRRRKRRPKEYSLLTKPRQWYHRNGDKHAR